MTCQRFLSLLYCLFIGLESDLTLRLGRSDAPGYEVVEWYEDGDFLNATEDEYRCVVLRMDVHELITEQFSCNIYIVKENQNEVLPTDGGRSINIGSYVPRNGKQH